MSRIGGTADDFLDGFIRRIYRIARLSQKLELNSEQCKEEILGNIRETRDLIPSFPELIVVLVDDLYRKPDLTEKEFMKAMKNVNNSKTARQKVD